MGIVNLKTVLTKAKKEKYAVGAFNIFNYLFASAVLKAAEELRSPVIIQTSVPTVKKFGPKQLGKMLTALAENASVPVVLHLDHCTDVALAKECVDAGWTSIMIDASSHPLEENIRITQEVKAYAAQRNVSVEGELGIIKGVEDDIVHSIDKAANYEDSIYYIQATGVDALAPAIGTAHGYYTGEPVINFDLVKKLSDTTDVPVVIHGGTGLAEDVFKRLIECEGAKINVSTALKYVYLQSAQNYLDENQSNRNPSKFDDGMENGVKEAVKYHIALFGSSHKA